MKTWINRSLIAAALFTSWIQDVRAANPTFTISPAAVSNTYVGPITLQISGLTTGDPVVVQKFGDVVTNGVIANGDVLVQQFNLTDNQGGMVVGGVTNFAVPFDSNPTNGVITATLGFPYGDFSQKIIGKYGFVLSSPVGHFTPITNIFNVTNFPFGQTITGTVVSNGTSTAIPYAGVIFFPAPRPGHDLGTPVAGTVANNLGVYTIQVPPGTYVPLAFQSNYVASYASSPVVTVTNTQTVTTNLSLIAATASISGQVVDALNPSIVLPGLFVAANNSSKFIATGSTDTNGNFTIRVTAGQWQVSGNPEGLGLHGYVAYNNGTNLNAGTTGFVGGFYKATSLFYGTVKDNLGNPLQEIPIGANDNNYGEFYNDGYEDTNGNYTVGAVGGLGSGDPWQVGVDNQSQFPNEIFSQSALNQNGGTNLAAGQAVRQNFTAILATNQISGHVQFNGTNVIGVQVFAYATIGTKNYQAQADTDSNGNYSLNVANGNWNVNIYDCGCSDSDSLNNVIGGGIYQGNYQGPASQNVNIANNNGTANFTVPFCGGVSFITSSPLPNGTNGDYYNFQFNASSCSGNLSWSVNDPQDVPSGLTLYSGGAFNGTPGGSGTYNFSVNVNDGNGHQTNQSFSLYIAPANIPLQIMIYYLPNATNTIFYSQTLQASGGQPPYSWSIPAFSADLPPNLTLATNGVLSGTPATTANTYYFDVIVTDAAASTAELDGLSLTIVNPPLPPLVITNTSLPNGNVGAAYSAQLGATGGQPGYTWSLATGSANPPAGLTLSFNGLISGTPTTNKVSTFKVQVMDSTFVTATNKVLSITINPKPVLGAPSWLTNRFNMQLTGASNQNYTIQMSTNLSSANWISLFVTNNTTTNSYFLADPTATNKQRFYRILIGP